MATSLNTASSPSDTTTQTSTQNPQTSSTQVSSLQPVETSSVLTNVSGLTLQSRVLPTTQLRSTTISTQPPTPTTTPHHSAGLTAASIILFLVAITLFGSTMRGAKNTTK